jgi:23S rRNA (guanine745-N1)-methyltransferase
MTEPRPVPAWRCPTCARPLAEDGRGAWCDQGHRVDRARDGSLHLLPAGRHKPRAVGDTAEMLRARRAVFDAGHYRPVQEAVARAATAHEPHTVLDAGCGEGSYLAAIEAPSRLGIDVAKPAVSLAARRWKSIRWAVASSHRIPLDDATVDTVVSVFAPRPFAEFRRVLRPDGIVVTASPGPDHLGGLVEWITGEAEPHEQRPHVTNSDGDAEQVRYELKLTDPADIANLVTMTPYWIRIGEERRAELATRGSLTTTVDVMVSRHRAR